MEKCQADVILWYFCKHFAFHTLFLFLFLFLFILRTFRGYHLGMLEFVIYELARMCQFHWMK